MIFSHELKWLYLLVPLAYSLVLLADGLTKVQMRVVKDTASYGYFGSNIGEIENNNQLLAAMEPSNFSGPTLLQRLLGKCYNLTQDRYRYEFCPFQNFTQYEVSSRWNSYQGVLGIWSHWNIENNTFDSMVYSHGDHCGDVDRTVQVILRCGSKETLSNVTEPRRCQYVAFFITKYICHKDAVLVYPRLEPELQKQWDQLLTEFHYGDITEKGYRLGLEKIFQLAGLSGVKNNIKSSNVSTTEAARPSDNIFVDLQSCNKEYTNLQKEVSQLTQEIEALKLLLDLRDVQNRTNKPHK